MKPTPQMTTKATLDQTHYNVVRLLVIGLLFHLIYIGSVFDCYFTSPVVHGMRSYGSGDSVAPSKRLVLIVGDGLRADLLFTPNAFTDIPGSDSLGVVAPYLRSVVETRGAFGISHTRVPTESRPGHVAIIGGMYEDVSAVTKGWKSNPVDFDSVFNRSSTTFSFGSPDIIPMFARGAIPEKVKTWCYDEDAEDFTKDATALDTWVLDHLKALLKNATADPVLDFQLRSEKVIFFLHLLGLDTTGHSYRPYSKEYMENIRVVDNIVRETEKLISEFYKDKDTSFVFTSDHGMSTIGNHGDGHPDNTRTPLIAWGSGVRGPLPDTHPPSHDAYSEPWKLEHLFRRDLEQADVATLMAALVGIDWPVNSVGVIPDVDPKRPGYLKLKDGNKGKAKIGLINAKVILEQYRIKDDFKRKHSLFYTPFPLLTPSTTHDQGSDALSYPQMATIENLILEKQWFAARQASSILIQQALQGLHYLQTYDRFLIRGIVSAAYMGWTAYAVLHILRHRDFRSLGGGKPSSLSTSPTFLVTVGSCMVLLAFWTLFALQRSPWSFYVYIMFPCYFWWRVLEELGTAISDRNYRRAASDTPGSGDRKNGFVTIVIKVATVVLALQGMVAGYTYRTIWSIGFVLIGVVWPLFWNDEARSKISRTIYARWAMSCLVTAIFPLLLVDKKENLLTITAGGVTILSTGLLGAYHAAGGIVGKPHLRRSFLILTMIQTAFIAIAIIITVSSASKLQAKAGLPLVNQAIGWVVLVVSSLIPFLYPSGLHTVPLKLVMYFLGFGPCFVILSIREEGLFYVAYSITLFHWIQVEQIARLGSRRENGDTVNEKTAKRSRDYSFQWDDVRTALFFLFFVQVGFFGTGNVASISSFYLAPVYRLIPIFNPFYMTTLLIFKLVVPYIILAVTFSVLNDTLNLPPFSLLLVALTISDGMTLTFFFKVQDTGSWLEIGQSITFFCITSLLLLWSASICVTGEYLMKDALTRNVGGALQVSAEKKKG